MVDAESPDSAAVEAAEEKVREIIQTGGGRDSPQLPGELQHLAEKRDKQEIDLRRTYAVGLIVILSVQLVIADVVFVVYAWAGKNWDLSTAVIDTWLGAVVVQVIGVVAIVTRHLFPRRDRAS